MAPFGGLSQAVITIASTSFVVLFGLFTVMTSLHGGKKDTNTEIMLLGNPGFRVLKRVFSGRSLEAILLATILMLFVNIIELGAIILREYFLAIVGAYMAIIALLVIIYIVLISFWKARSLTENEFNLILQYSEQENSGLQTKLFEQEKSSAEEPD